MVVATRRGIQGVSAAMKPSVGARQPSVLGSPEQVSGARLVPVPTTPAAHLPQGERRAGGSRRWDGVLRRDSGNSSMRQTTLDNLVMLCRAHHVRHEALSVPNGGERTPSAAYLRWSLKLRGSMIREVPDLGGKQP